MTRSKLRAIRGIAAGALVLVVVAHAIADNFTYLVSVDGRLSSVEGDPALAENVQYWTLNLYCEGQSPASSKPWGAISRGSYDAVLAEYKRDAAFDVKYEKFMGRESNFVCGSQHEYGNYQGPIAVLRATERGRKIKQRIDVLRLAAKTIKALTEGTKIMQQLSGATPSGLPGPLRDYLRRVKLALRDASQLEALGNKQVDDLESQLAEVGRRLADDTAEAERLRPPAEQALTSVAPASSSPGQMVKRPNWICPNGLEFPECGHSCKWVQLGPDGYPNREREAQCTAEAAQHLPFLKTVQSSALDAAKKFPDGCASVVLSTVYGISRMKGPNGAPLSDAEAMKTLQNGPGSKVIDANDAILFASGGHPVVATGGAFGIVIPGGSGYSTRWKMNVPVVIATRDDQGRSLTPLPRFADSVYRTTKPTYRVVAAY